MPICSYALCSTLVKKWSILPGATYPYVPVSEVQLDFKIGISSLPLCFLILDLLYKWFHAIPSQCKTQNQNPWLFQGFPCTLLFHQKLISKDLLIVHVICSVCIRLFLFICKKNKNIPMNANASRSVPKRGKMINKMTLCPSFGICFSSTQVWNHLFPSQASVVVS